MELNELNDMEREREREKGEEKRNRKENETGANEIVYHIRGIERKRHSCVTDRISVALEEDCQI
jgi:hypothetical protein